jgi:hypothetical protein
MAQRPRETHAIDGLSFTIEALPFDKATDILADVQLLVANTLEAGIESIIPLFKSGKLKLDADGIEKIVPLILPALSKASRELADRSRGTSFLKWLEPRLLETVTVVGPFGDRGDKETRQLIHAKDRAEVFDAFPSTYYPVLFVSGRLSFARYFPVAAAAADGSR